MPSTCPKKLQSLQGLRGISILSVLLFHLFPHRFINGFVGVDMFFVLSGYLITRILSKPTSSTFKSILEFYKKRFIRIVPLYYLTILGVIIGVLTLVLRSERDDFISDVFWSLPAISNFQPIFEHHTYWQQVSSIRYLTHLWSLCTELQYYLIAPIIQLIASHLSFPNRILGYTIAMLLLFTFQLLAPFEYSYCFLASRVWQFLLGSVAFEVGNWSSRGPLQSRNLEKSSAPLLIFQVAFLAILAICLALPWVIGEHATRLAMSLATTLFCMLCGNLEKNSIFTFSPLTWLGGISYVMYLIHWPVINFVRYIQQRDHTEIDFYEAGIAVIIILVLSVLAHFFLEVISINLRRNRNKSSCPAVASRPQTQIKFQKKLLQLSFPSNFTLSILTLALSYSLIPWLQNYQCLSLNSLPPNLQNHVQFNLNPSNLLINISDLPCDSTEKNANFPFDLFGIEYCAHKGTGNGTILVIGNSISIRAFPMIFELLNGRYEEIRLFSKHGGAPLFNIFDYYTNAARQMAEELNPDLLWIIQGVKEITYPENPLTTFDSDSLDRIVAEKMDEFKVLAKSVYVDLPYFITKDYPAKLIARSLIYGKNLEEKLAVSLEKVEEQVGEQTERLLNLNCSNCHFNDIQKVLINDSDKFYFYEPETFKALNYDGDHLALAAFEYIKPIYKSRIEQFFRLIS